MVIEIAGRNQAANDALADIIKVYYEKKFYMVFVMDEYDIIRTLAKTSLIDLIRVLDLAPSEVLQRDDLDFIETIHEWGRRNFRADIWGEFVLKMAKKKATPKSIVLFRREQGAGCTAIDLQRAFGFKYFRLATNQNFINPATKAFVNGADIEQGYEKVIQILEGVLPCN